METGIITVADGVRIPESEIRFEHIRASGPGGQNVNKVASAVQLRFNVYTNNSLSHEVKERLIKYAGKRMATDGTLTIKAQNQRTQHLNRRDAMVRFTELITRAVLRPKKRLTTKPTKGSVLRRLESKRRRAAVKKRRRAAIGEE